MAKAVAKVGKIVGAVASIAAMIPGPHQPIAMAIAAGSAVISTAAQSMIKPPPVRGSVSQILVQADAVQPYVMGAGYYAGVLRHDTAYGPTLKKVPNPYRFQAVVYSGGGPVQSITPQVDYKNIGSWYSGFLYTDTQLGACPEADALSPQWAGATGWGSDYKLSGQAAIGWSFKFDKEGEVFASGLPLQGAIGQWVKAYDPRKDSTQPGGSGAHRLGNESTYEWTENPALHAGTYAYGRYQNGKRTMGMGLPADGIEWAVVSAWANVCEANDWTMFGVVYEPGDRWANLKDICFAGGAEPVAGGKLSFKYAAPVIALDTITDDDLTDDIASVMAMQSFRDRINTAVPKYRSAAHNWEIVDAEPVVNATFLAEDGEEKRETWPFNFVTDVDQAAVLAAYRIWETRELAPITLPCKPRMRYYRPGECLHIDLPDLGLDTDAIILRREIDPATMTVTLELMGETPAKHAYCLGQIGTAPPTPAIGQTAEERDRLAAEAGLPADYDAAKARHEDPAALLYFADYKGVLADGQLPDTFRVKRFAGDVDVSDLATWTIVSNTGITGGTLTVAGGVVTIPAGVTISSSGGIVVRSELDGVIISSTVSYKRELLIPPSESGQIENATVSTNITNTTKIDVSGEMVVSTGASGDLYMYGLLSIIAAKESPIGNFGAVARWQYKPDGGSFTNIGASDIEETYTANVDFEPPSYMGNNGSINTEASISGLDPDTEYTVRLMMARDSASPAKTIGLTGTVFAQGS